MPELTINLVDEAPQAYAVARELIEQVLGGAYARRGQAARAAVNLLVTSDEEIAQMNEQYLDHSGPTDVLAFDDGDEEDGVLLLGDIAVSADTAARMAVEKGMSFDEELALYCLHGLLHLLGMRDHTDELREEMITAQREEFAHNGLKYEV